MYILDVVPVIKSIRIFFSKSVKKKKLKAYTFVWTIPLKKINNGNYTCMQYISLLIN